MKKTFTLPAPAGPHDLIGTLHYYQWLKATKVQDVHRIHTKREYLQEQGFRPERHRLSEEQVNILRAAEEVYFFKEVKPTLVSDNKAKGGIRP